MSIRTMTEWFSDAYWHWRNVFYFRFSEYNDNIDRCAFFEELNYGWHQMYADDEFWGPANVLSYSSEQIRR